RGAPGAPAVVTRTGAVNAPSPVPFLAATRNSWIEENASDEIVAVRLEALALAAVRHPDHPAPAVKLRASTTYPVTGRPPVWSGSSHVRLAVRSTSRALSPTGTPGTAA